MITTCTDWSFGVLGNTGDQLSDIDVQWMEYRFVGDVLHLLVRHAPFNPATTTSVAHVQLWDDGTNALDFYWDGTAHFTYTTDSVSWFDLPADPDLTIDTSLASAAGMVVYTVPVDIVQSYLSSAVVPTEIFGGAYAYIPGTGFTDVIFPYPDTLTNINWTTRDQCYWPLASNIDPEGDTFDLVDYGAISFNAESGRFRARIDFYQEVTLGTQEVQAYLWDQSIPSGYAVTGYAVYSGALHLIVRDWLGSFSFPTAPGGCTTYPTDLTAATRMILVDCAQSAIQSTVATYAGEFVFNSAHSYRMGGVSWDYLGYQDDLFPDGWTVYTDLDPIVIP